MNFITKVVLVVCFVATVESCTCIPQTQQRTYCTAAWISRAKILGIQNVNLSIEYTVEHIEIFKTYTSSLPSRVITPSPSGACGQIGLDVGQEYLLAGTANNETNTLHLSICLYMPGNDIQPSGVLSWSKVPSELYQKLLKKDFQPCSAK